MSCRVENFLLNRVTTVRKSDYENYDVDGRAYNDEEGGLLRERPYYSNILARLDLTRLECDCSSSMFLKTQHA